MFKSLFIPVLALLIVGTAAAQNTKTATQFYEEGQKLNKNEKYEEALAQYKKAIALNANYKEALYEAGWVCCELEKYNDALLYLEKANKLWPNQYKIYKEIGYAYDKLDNLREAENNYKKCIELEPETASAYSSLAYIYYDQGKYEEALYHFKKYIQYEDNVNDKIYRSKGYCENELELYSDAIRSLNKAIQLAPKNASNYIELAFSYYQLKDADNALKNYNKGLAADPKSYESTNGIADVYRNLKKDIPEAIKRYKYTTEIAPNNKRAYYWIGWCYNDLGQYEDAGYFLKKAVQIDSKYVDAITELGYSDYALEKYDDALEDFRKSMAIEKTELNVYYSGLCYVGKKQKTEAQKMVKELEQMKSDYAKTLSEKIKGM